MKELGMLGLRAQGSAEDDDTKESSIQDGSKKLSAKYINLIAYYLYRYITYQASESEFIVYNVCT